MHGAGAADDVFDRGPLFAQILGELLVRLPGAVGPGDFVDAVTEEVKLGGRRNRGARGRIDEIGHGADDGTAGLKARSARLLGDKDGGVMTAAGVEKFAGGPVINAVPDGEVFVVVLGHGKGAVEPGQDRAGITKVDAAQALGAEDIQDGTAEERGADPVAGDIEEIEREGFTIERMITEAVAAEMRTGQVAPLGGDRTGERVGQKAADVGGGLGELGLEATLGAFQGLQHALEFLAGVLELSDVVDRALVVEEVAGVVANRADVFGDPDGPAVAATDFGLEVEHLAVLLHDADKLSAAVGIDVDLRGDVVDAVGELVEGSVAVHFHQRRIRRDVLALGGGLEDAFEGVLENALVFVLGETEGLIGLLALLDFVLEDPLKADRRGRGIRHRKRRGLFRKVDFIGRSDHGPGWRSLYHARDERFQMAGKRRFSGFIFGRWMDKVGVAMDIVKSTRLFEEWLGRRIPVVEADLLFKHEQMRADPFLFFRATFYRWAQVWPKLCPKLARCRTVLAVGDLHLENFGTWRDAEGRLVWGVNDFDEAYPMAFTNDLVRTATSALLSLHVEPTLKLTPADIFEQLNAGYLAALEEGGEPFILMEKHPKLRRMATQELRQPYEFWKRLEVKTSDAKDLPKGLGRAFEKILPPGVKPSYRVVKTPKGLGSLGRRRFLAVSEWQGGMIAREAKDVVASARLWAEGKSASKGNPWLEKTVRAAVRGADPFYEVKGRWLLRRLAPDCSRIDLDELKQHEDLASLLNCMGWETANIHLGTPKVKKTLVKTLRRLPKSWLKNAAETMFEKCLQDWKRFRESKEGALK